MENNKFVLIPLHLWEQGSLQFPSIDTNSGDGRIHFFKREQPDDPSCIGKGLIASKKTTKDTDSPRQKGRLKDFLNGYRKNSNLKKIISELFENKASTFSLDNTIVVDKTDTEVIARDFIHSLRRKNGSFDPKYSIVLNTLNFPQSYMTSTVALTNDDNSWLSVSS